MGNDPQRHMSLLSFNIFILRVFFIQIPKDYDRDRKVDPRIPREINFVIGLPVRKSP